MSAAQELAESRRVFAVKAAQPVEIGVDDRTKSRRPMLEGQDEGRAAHGPADAACPGESLCEDRLAHTEAADQGDDRPGRGDARQAASKALRIVR